MSIFGTSVSGMMSYSNWLSEISQNVANANTTGYKDAETQFSTLVDQAAGNAANFAGVKTSVRSLNSLQGTTVGTNTTTDLAVQGAGYFVVSNSSGALYLTRNGSFVPDASGDLVNSAGYYLMGYNSSSAGASVAAGSVSGLQKVNVTTSGESATPTTAASISANLPSTAAIVTAANLPSQNTAGSTFTAQTTMVGYDDLGGAHTLDVYFSKTASNTWEADVYDHSTAAAGGGFPYSSGPLTTATLSFNPTTGALSGGSPLSFAVPGGQTVSLDLSSTTQLATAFGVSATTANGNAPGTETGVAIAPDGTLTFQYSNGGSRPGYDIPIANVPSPDNMTNMNGDAFSTNAQSGQMNIGSAGGAGFGSIQSSSLESSTVDLATQLTDMIQAQSDYQANSKVFQTGANLLDVLNGLKA